MSLTKGDHLLIKRDGKILTPDAGESYHEFVVLENPVSIASLPDGTPIGADYVHKEGVELIQGYTVRLGVVQ